MAIRSFEHAGLERFFRTGSKRGIVPAHAARLQLQLSALDAAEVVTELALPGWHLHQLKGDQKGRWAITVRANWRLTFDFADGDAFIVNYEDYH